MSSLTVTAGVYNAVLEQGATWLRNVTWWDGPGDTNPHDLTGYTAKLKVKESFDSSTALISLTEASGITLGGAAGTIDIVITAAQTAKLDATQGFDLVWDLELTHGSTVTRLLQGAMRVSGGVSL